MHGAADLVAAIAAATAVTPRFSTASDEELLADLDAVEQLGRLVDGLRVKGAAQAEHRFAAVRHPSAATGTRSGVWAA